MTRDSRYNLIFLVVLLALTIPPFALVFRQKLVSTARSNAEPDPVPRTIAYISPQETPPGMVQVLPDRTAAWRVSVLQAALGQNGVLPKRSDGLPVTSALRGFELLGLRQDRSEIHIVLLIWDKSLAGPETSWTIDGQPAQFQRSEAVEIPQAVREELGENGLLVQPKTVWLKSLTLTPSASVRRLTARVAKGTFDSIEIVPSFTSPASTKN